MANNPLNAKQTRYIIIRRYLETPRATIKQIYEEMTDPDAWEKFGIEPDPTLSRDYFYQRVKDIPETTKETMKAEWMLDELAEPYANGRARIIELSKVINDPTTPPAVRVNALRAIGDISGDTDAKIKAIAASGKVSMSERLFEKYDKKEEN